MVLNISISPKAEARLKKRAAEQGKDPGEFASDLVERAVTRPSLQQLLAASQAEFSKAGKTPDQVMGMGRRIVNRVRASRGSTAF